MRQRKTETEAAPLDPIALSLALWLGLMVGVLGLQHMAEQAAQQQAMQQQRSQQPMTGQHARAGRPVPAQAFAAWGG